MIPKKNPKADYSRYSLIFFQLGLIIMVIKRGKGQPITFID